MSTNPYRMLRELLPEPPLQVGTVLSITGGVATIEVPGGNRTNARGNTTIGQRVYFRDNAIQGVAPILPIEVIEIG